ncbi:ABC transporter permease [Phototrophicus methaneseepsis]|uniref:ABC transporter permease n=1 Tax=Phototrophicus methaneseepsis TaxID=2710758 RepID=A0A7S8IGV8_9CHLR|nr:ABC transporter permease [Phototrophicus methaneseepsis]
MNTPADDTPQILMASQWQLMWWKFRKHRLAMISLFVIIALYIIAIFAGFFAPKATATYFRRYTSAPPQPIYWFDEGRFAPYVYGYSQETDPRTLARVYTVDEEVKIPLGFFVHGDEYQIGLNGIPVSPINKLAITMDIHLFGPMNPEDPFYLFGADDVGRDMFSRLIYGSQVSLSIGLVGVFLSLVLGIFLGGISGLVGGWLDNFIQRLIEVLRSIPDIPLWMALATAVPARWDPVYVYFCITLILSLLGWTGMARVVRGKFLSLREEDFIIAAELDAVPRNRIIFKHMIPSFMSHIIASATLAIPGMILGETALSFLGLGLRAPVVSWGVMLQDAINISAIANMPWLLLPGAAVVITVLAFNFLGDGLRDAADPYHT